MEISHESPTAHPLLGVLAMLGGMLLAYAGYLLRLEYPALAFGGSVFPQDYPYVSLVIIAFGGTIALCGFYTVFPSGNDDNDR